LPISKKNSFKKSKITDQTCSIVNIFLLCRYAGGGIVVMNLFVNDIPVHIYRAEKVPDPSRYHLTIDARSETITRARLVHHVWIQQVSGKELDEIFQILNSRVPIGLSSLHLTVTDYEQIKTHLRSKFSLVKAAGGLVRKRDKFLMIYRMKKWDLPKGKKEKGEKYREAAVREVEEECNITVKGGAKICTTWHTYTMNRKAMLKKTRWYVMDLIDDSRMRPDSNEDIEEIRWMNPREVYHALEHSYKSISYVFERYYQMMEVTR
jgi:8-oxo-dGTP pyrophosphatase MutT (NUDIX family)